MKDALIICGAIFGALVVGSALVMLIVAILPFLIACGCLALIYWMIYTCFTGGFRR
jgi:hypothetical protein